MDEKDLARIRSFVSQYKTLVIATEHEGQPYATRIFFVENPAAENTLKLYGTLITTSRKLANLEDNPRVGIFIGPDHPSIWLEATARARVLNENEEASAAEVRSWLTQKSPEAGAFISRVPTAAVELEVTWARLTDLTSSTPSTEIAPGNRTTLEGQQA
ncbi:MAG TPA: pyridoxamine 5'-phosphate oxidase family protein [Ktedonobacteraceae bacterium]|jgi:nitroimidazol reductase NimA-like FMN-containing flavoprotein (pyridoxamine 5'-phosphate oxidase superfamily)|nr:pyridoxamine 5'-phosphate oxidase family protein [Ktedonobacteraceae bacterium]